MGLVSLGALLFGPLLLLPTPLRPVAIAWVLLLTLATWYFLAAAVYKMNKIW